MIQGSGFNAPKFRAVTPILKISKPEISVILDSWNLKFPASTYS